MNLIFSVYTSGNYKEVHLPVTEDSNYELILRAGEFQLSEDLTVKLEATEGAWRFQSDPAYRVLLNDRDFEGENIQPGQLFLIRTGGMEEVAIFAWSAAERLEAFKKYTVTGARITIGLDPRHDICYANQAVVSHDHAELRYEGGRAYIRDNSRNGTYLNSCRIQNEAELHFGDLISLYGLSILFLGNVLAIGWLGKEVEIRSDHLKEITSSLVDGQTRAAGDEVGRETVVHISPRNLIKLYDETETIENVPSKSEENRKPAWMSILPPLTMVLPMLVGFSLMNNGMGFGIIISAGSAAMGVIWAIINYRFAARERKFQEKRRLERYEEYLVQCTDRIREKFEYNRQALLKMYPDAATCSGYTEDSVEIWARKPRHFDFLYLRLGLGEMPFQVKINVPARGFTLTDDELADRPGKIAQNYRTLRDVPLGADLKKYPVVGILAGGDRAVAAGLARVLITQLAANYCYTDVKLAVLYKGENDTAALWDYTRWLPHVWNEDRSMRYVAKEEQGANDVLYALTQILRGRLEQTSDLSRRGSQFLPHYVLVVEDPAMLESQPISKYLYEHAEELGVTTVILADTYESLPSACGFVVEKSGDFEGIYSVESDGETRQSLRFDSLEPEQAEALARRMSSMRINQVESGSDIPASLTFFDMMKVRTLEELDVLDHWRKNRTYENMRAAIGQKMGGQTCYLDIMEKYHGPHGLVAGTTGSGKSETLQTYILSLAVNFSPMDVSFFIIDFKGGGMANLFAGLPHMVGQISNLSGNQVRRAMVSIKSENLRRQRIFGEYGVNHIDAYTKLVKNKEASMPIPHLLIIIDEFAELKREEPEFMRELISVAQVGRSLGVHLILATQRPSGTVDENIWSNTKFKLCLRVADKQDSNDMLHKPDAAFLTQVGRGYMQVGNDEIYELFQSGWSGAVYDDSGENVQSTAALLNLQGREPALAGKGKNKRKQAQDLRWMETVTESVLWAADQIGVERELSALDQGESSALAKKVVERLNEKEERYPESASSLRRIEEVFQLWPTGLTEKGPIAEYLMEQFQLRGKKLPERLEKTQLSVVVDYLAQLAREYSFTGGQKLWMPLLPERLELSRLPGWQEHSWQEGKWPEKTGFSLRACMGLLDDPENQLQYPLSIDLAEKGHLMVVGGVTSGKSTFLQTLVYSLISTYSPQELNVYAVDFSSQMLCAFEGDAHVGGVVMEGEDEKLNKLFVMLGDMLRERKKKIRGGSFGQYVQVHGNDMPAVLLVIDGYANFNEKTAGQFESNLLELSRSAEGYGIYLAISCAGFGSGELQNKIANNMRQSVCLELGDKYSYGEALRTMHFDVLPEENVKGRGLALVEGNVLEFQTALCCLAANDYERSEQIRERCREMTQSWTGGQAAPIPTIPEKPTWAHFTAMPQYTALLKQGDLLPVAYVQETAAIYSVDLARTYCYLILGGDRSGKTTLLRDLMCAARDGGAGLRVIDPDGSEQAVAQALGAKYYKEHQDMSDMIRELTLLTNERAARRKELRQKGLDDEEIFRTISGEFPAVDYFISDLKAFLDMIYTNAEGIGRLNSWVESIFAKGQLLNVHFFAAANLSQIPNMVDKPAYSYFIKEKSGVLLGGELNRQNVFAYQNIRYNDQGKRLKAGMGYATDPGGEQTVELIVVPNHRGAAEL